MVTFMAKVVTTTESSVRRLAVVPNGATAAKLKLAIKAPHGAFFMYVGVLIRGRLEGLRALRPLH